jgi:cell division protein FtsZ
MLIKPTTQNIGAKIIICGVGGGGNNAINSMIESNEIQGVQFIAVNTDAQVLDQSLAETVIPIGKDLTKGLGGGGNPAVGKQAAEDSVDYLNEALAGSDMVFITAGMGGATGTGASPVIAGISKQLGALTVGVVTKPFTFEGSKKSEIASKGIEDLKAKVDALIVIPNQRVLEIADRNVSFRQAMQKSDEVLLNAIKSISDIITITGEMNVDFADVKAIMKDAGTALMGMGISGNKDTRAIDAAKMAINSPLLDYSIDGAKGVLISIRGSSTLSLTEISEAVEVVRQYVDEDANIKFGVHIDDDLGDAVMINVLATGFEVDPIDAEINQRKVLQERAQNTNAQVSNRNFQESISRPTPIQSQATTPSPNFKQKPATTQNEDDFFDEIEKRPAWERMKQNKLSGQQPTQNDNNNNDDDYNVPQFVKRRGPN